MFNPRTNFEVSTITCYEDMKGNAKCRNCGGLGWLRVTQGHSPAMLPFDRAHTAS